MAFYMTLVNYVNFLCRKSCIVYFYQFHSNVNIKGQHFPIYGDSWPWVCQGLGPSSVLSHKGPVSSKVLGPLSGGIKVKILEVVDWSQVQNHPSQLESVAATKISRSQGLQVSSSFFKLPQASSRFLKQQPEPGSVVTEISRQKTNHKNDAFCRISP